MHLTVLPALCGMISLAAAATSTSLMVCNADNCLRGENDTLVLKKNYLHTKKNISYSSLGLLDGTWNG